MKFCTFPDCLWGFLQIFIKRKTISLHVFLYNLCAIKSIAWLMQDTHVNENRRATIASYNLYTK